jgi:hypothetical protein
MRSTNAQTILAVAAALTSSVTAAGTYSHVLVFSVDGMHGSDVEKYIAERPKSIIASLLETGYEYTNAFTTTVSGLDFPPEASLTNGSHLIPSLGPLLNILEPPLAPMVFGTMIPGTAHIMTPAPIAQDLWVLKVSLQKIPPLPSHSPAFSCLRREPRLQLYLPLVGWNRPRKPPRS